MTTINYSSLQQYLPFTVLKRNANIIKRNTRTVPGCNSTYRLRYWNFWHIDYSIFIDRTCVLQQYLPFTVLKRSQLYGLLKINIVSCNSTYRLRYWNYFSWCQTIFNSFHGCNSTYRLRYWNLGIAIARATNSWLCCNSTYRLRYWNIAIAKRLNASRSVATVLTVYGIETSVCNCFFYSNLQLQQYLPFTVLKLVTANLIDLIVSASLQQHLPFTVLKLLNGDFFFHIVNDMLQQYLPFTVLKHAMRCISGC